MSHGALIAPLVFGYANPPTVMLAFYMQSRHVREADVLLRKAIAWSNGVLESWHLVGISSLLLNLGAPNCIRHPRARAIRLFHVTPPCQRMISYP